MLNILRNRKSRFYLKLIFLNLLVIIINQIVCLICIRRYIQNVTLKNIFICIMFCFCSVLCIIVTLVVSKEFSYFDLLTGTYTREKMYFDLAKLIKNKQKFIVMYIDLNNFKEINDSYGHLAGDKVLESFGYRTSKLGDDIKCYRMGGDEFILIAGLQISTKDKLKKFVNSDEFDFSYGVSEFPIDTEECKCIKEVIEKLILVADNKMYANKISERVG